MKYYEDDELMPKISLRKGRLSQEVRTMIRKIKETPLNVYELEMYTYKNNFGLQKQLMKLRSWTMLVDMYVSIQWYGRND
eukprot:8527236-Heterocapsa_arctica.AAC.1